MRQALYPVHPAAPFRMLAAAALLLALFLPARGALAAEPAAADGVVRATADELLALVNDARGYYATDPDRLHRSLADILGKFVDLPAIASSVMGRFRADATDAQKERFAEAFKWSLVRTYAKAMMEFSVDRIEFGATTSEGRADQATVHLTIVGKDGKAYPVEYAMRQAADGAWRVRNMTIAALNFGLTYRSQFEAAMAAAENGGSIDKVIDGWSRAVDAQATPAAPAP
jgi:phospholipid transport system substrate-binding protein